MWTDQLVTTFEGKSVQVTRVIGGPGYDEKLKMTFGDGSMLRISFDANVNVDCCEGEADVMDAGMESQAGVVWGAWVKSLYDAAALKSMGVDF